jgi:hypothetical protein
MSAMSGRQPAIPRHTWFGYAWFAVVFVLFNSCAGHRETWQTGVWISGGDWSPGPAFAVRAIRAACNDDGDINRYLAYANAILGRPYQAHYVRPMDAWMVEPEDDGKDYNDPSVVVPVRPLHALVPYRDFSVEYPPGFFAFAVLPALVSSNMDAYRVLFSLFMGLLLTLGLWLCWRMAEKVAPDKAVALVRSATWAALALGVVLVRRFDATVAASLCVVVWGCFARKPALVGVALGAGIAAKLVPVFVVPLVAAFWLTRKRTNEAVVAAATAAATVLALSSPFVLASGSGVLKLVTYHGGRPLEIESTGGALLILSRLVAPAGVTLSRAFGSSSAVSTWDGPVRAASSVLLVLAFVYVGGWTMSRMRREPDDRAATVLLARASCAVLVAWMVFGKVFSPQYVTWLMPLGVLVSVIDGERTEKHLFGIFALTQLIYPFVFKIAGSNALSPWFGALVLLRNGLLLAWGISILRGGLGLLAAREAAANSTPAARGVEFHGDFTTPPSDNG